MQRNVAALGHLITIQIVADTTYTFSGMIRKFSLEV